MTFDNSDWRFILALTLLLSWSIAPDGLAQMCTNPSVFEAGKTISQPLSQATALVGTASTDPGIIRKRVDEVVAFFTVTKGHKYIQDLTQSEIRIVDDGKPPARISEFGRESDLPLRLGILMDTSDSVSLQFEFEQKAASHFLR